jgi:hypothetical protein
MTPLIVTFSPDPRGPFGPCHELSVIVPFFSSCGSLLRALTIFHTQRIFVLGTAISDVRLTFPKHSPHISHLYPSTNPTHTRLRHIIQYTPRTRRYSFASTILSYCITDSSLAVSICVPFFVPRSFRSFCPNSLPSPALGCVSPYVPLSLLSTF